MSTLHSSGKHYREEFEPRRPWRRRAALISILVALASVSHYAAFLSGAMLNDSRCRARVAAAVAVRPACAALAPASDALTQWKCTASEFKEHRDACKHRLLSDFRIPPKE